jgi:class 3 adenylate cyclase
MAEWPSGTVTFLFTDLEGSTQRWQQYPTAMGPALARHDRLLREAIAAHGGVVFKTIGDAVCAAFATAPAAVAAALTAQRALYAEPWGSTGPLRVRMALHTGQAEVQAGDYLGGPLNRVARLLALAHGGQVLLSGPTADLVLDYLPPGASLRDLGTHRLKDVQRPEHVFQLVVPDLPWEFPPLAASGSQSFAPTARRGAGPHPSPHRLPPLWIGLTAAMVLAVALAAVLARQVEFGGFGRGPQSPPTLVAAVGTSVDALRASAVALTPTAPAPTPSPTATPAATATRAALVASEPSPQREATGAGRVVYSVYGGQPTAEHMYRIAAQAAATPEDLSDTLDALAPGGRDHWVDVSPDGAWLVLGTERFDPECTGWPCLAVAPADLSTAEIVRVAGDVVHPGGPGAIAGDLVVVFPLADGPHETDLWAIRRQGEGWGEALLLTGDSPYAYHAEPALSADGTWVVFECGDRPYGELGTALCEVGTDGTRFHVVLEPADAPPGLPAEAALRQPASAPDGALVFEATWDGAVWRLPPGGAPERVAPGVDKDGAPCVLPDGRVASLWLGRPGGEGLHELKVTTGDGSEHIDLVPGVDIEHIGCGG